MPIAGTGREGIETARASRPDVVLVDIGLPDQSGLQVGSIILQDRPETKVIALTALEDTKLAREAIRIGFQGYVTKNADMHQFISALHSILAGSAVVSQRVIEARGRVDVDVVIEQLTERELEVLALIARGSSSLMIADELGITKNTVRTHVQSILNKLQVHSRLEAAAFAVRHGIAGPSRAGSNGNHLVRST